MVEVNKFEKFKEIVRICHNFVLPFLLALFFAFNMKNIFDGILSFIGCIIIFDLFILVPAFSVVENKVINSKKDAILFVLHLLFNDLVIIGFCYLVSLLGCSGSNDDEMEYWEWATRHL